MFGEILESLRATRRQLAEEYSQASFKRDDAVWPNHPSNSAYFLSLETRVSDYARAIDHIDEAIAALAPYWRSPDER